MRKGGGRRFEHSDDYQRQNGKDSSASSSSKSTSSSLSSKGAYWLFGHHAISLALANPKRQILRLLFTNEAKEKITLAYKNALCPSPPALEIVQRNELDRLLGADLVHQGAAALIQPFEAEAAEDKILSLLEQHDQGLVLILDQVTDPRNIGAILRSAAAFGVLAVIVPEKGSPGEGSALAKTASGALEIVPYLKTVNLVRFMEFLKQHDFWIYGLEGEAEMILSDAPKSAYRALILGAEGEGLRKLTKQNCDYLVKINMRESMIDSLNVSNAAAIALYALS